MGSASPLPPRPWTEDRGSLLLDVPGRGLGTGRAVCVHTPPSPSGGHWHQTRPPSGTPRTKIEDPCCFSRVAAQVRSSQTMPRQGWRGRLADWPTGLTGPTVRLGRLADWADWRTVL